jgi:serine/threonine-protein kinase RsbW
MAGDDARFTLPCDSLAPVHVRRHLSHLPDLGWPLGDAMLVATELVTNAVRHSMCNEDDTLLVSVAPRSEHVRISVHDPGRSGRAARIAAGDGWFGGLGLKIIDTLAARWGSSRDATGYEVWADLELVPSAQGDPGSAPSSPPRSGRRT